MTTGSLLHLGIWIFRWIGTSCANGLSERVAGVCWNLFWILGHDWNHSGLPDSRWTPMSMVSIAHNQATALCVCLLSTCNKWVCLCKWLKPLVKWGKCGHWGWERGNIKLSRRKGRFGMRLLPFGWFVYVHAVHFGMASYNYIKAENDGKKDERMLEIGGLYFLGLK